MKGLACTLAAAVGLIAAVANAQEAPAPGRVNVLIDIGRPGDRAIPIALPLPEGASAASKEFYEVVKHDLELSGYFKIISTDATLEPESAGLRPGEFDFADWRPLGAAVLGKTGISEADGRLRAEVWVYGVAAGEKLGAKAFSAQGGGVRSLAHRVADAIVYFVTGERSFFDTKFAFVADFTGNKEIYICDADGAGRRQLTKNGSINLKPRWNAAGSAITYTGYAAGNPDLYVADLAAGAIRRVSARAGINTGGSFSPVGNVLALALSVGSDAEIFTIDATSGREIARLTRSAGIDASPVWSPDGSQVAFVSERSGGPQVYVMNADGSNAHRVTFSGAHNTDPSWSPKGDRIAFVGRDGGFDVFTVGVDGKGMERITQGIGDNEDPSWSPDGNYLAFSSTREGGAHIWISSADGRFQTKVTSGRGGYTNPHWSPHLAW